MEKTNESHSRLCRFDPKTGIKKYKTKEICDYAFTAQKQAFELGIAPPVYERIDELSFRVGIADTSFFMDNLKPKKYYNKYFPHLHTPLKKIMENSPQKTWGPDGVDLARHNLGIWEGRIVMLDFS